MGWDYDSSLKRVQSAYDATAELTVGEVVRKTDLENTTLTTPRLITAAHFYVDVINFRALLAADPITMPGSDDSTGGGEEVLYRSHLWAREVSRIVQTDFDATKVHFQGPKLHALAYRPIGDDQAMVVKAVLTAAAIRASAKVFAEVLNFDESETWQTAAGVDFGEALVTKDGVRGDRELLFLGNPANRAAKIVNKGLRVTAEVADLLPDEFSSMLSATSKPDVFALAMSDTRLEQLVDDHGYGWSRDLTRKRLEQAMEKYPSGSATVRTATMAIDKDTLGMSNTKRVDAVSMFADVDGFTAYIEEANDLDELPEAVRAYHAIRSEMRHITVKDYDGLRVQYQGDRIQALAYLPLDNSRKAAIKAVRAAAALHSAVAEVLPHVVGSAVRPLAIGLAAGPVLVSKLGEHGNRDVVSLGVPTADAAAIQGRLDGGQTGLDTTLYSRLPSWLAELFKWNASACAYVADNLTLDEIEDAEQVAVEAEAKSQPGATSTIRQSVYTGSTVAETIRPYHRDY